jgi:hypothetical protein
VTLQRIKSEFKQTQLIALHSIKKSHAKKNNKKNNTDNKNSIPLLNTQLTFSIETNQNKLTQIPN